MARGVRSVGTQNYIVGQSDTYFLKEWNKYIQIKYLQYMHAPKSL